MSEYIQGNSKVWYNVRFQVLTAASMMFKAVFWVVLPCKMILHGSATQKTALNVWYNTSTGCWGDYLEQES
jgi:hypothetical protein